MSRRKEIFLISAAIFSECCRTCFRSVPTTRTAIGDGEPKLITLVTMSPGSNPKVDVTSSDGATNGFNYEDGTFSPDEVTILAALVPMNANASARSALPSLRTA